MADSFQTMPIDLPVPNDDGAADHLLGSNLPDIKLPSTSGGSVLLSEVVGTFVLYIYPMTGVPGTELPAGWDDVPGARGCTPQSCALRDYYTDIEAMGAELFGLSSQGTAYQQEMAVRLQLNFPVLSDADFAFAEALGLPSFVLHNVRYLKRLTMIVQNNVIRAVHYPVFPSTADPEWLATELSNLINNNA